MTIWSIMASFYLLGILVSTDAISSEVLSEASGTNEQASLQPNEEVPVREKTEARRSLPDIRFQSWEQKEWALVPPKTVIIELAGYFRIRPYLLKDLDFQNGSFTEVNTISGITEYLPRYHNSAEEGANFWGTNMRLRLEPRLKINDRISIITTFDLLDNLVLGSTPDSLTQGITSPPIYLLNRGQRAPRRNDNAFTDSIIVKRLFAQMHFLNDQLQLRVGRMPDHFGLGMLFNSGDGLDCDYGTIVDRLSFTFKLYHFMFQAMMDWVSKGPSYGAFGLQDPAPIDAVPWDDTTQFALRMHYLSHPEEIQEASIRNEKLFNYGGHLALRLQSKDIGSGFYDQNIDNADPLLTYNNDLRLRQSTPINTDGFLLVLDGYSRFYQGPLELSAEIAFWGGNFKDQRGNGKRTFVFSLGGVAQGIYHFRSDHKGVKLALKTGAASASHKDNAPQNYSFGFGALDATASAIEQSPSHYHTFQFSPDYHVDLILFRRLIGTVTGAWFISPEVAYAFEKHFLLRSWLTYSQAMYSQSTPSSLSPKPSNPLGVEIDAELAYGTEPIFSKSHLTAAFLGGILLPLSGSNHDTSAQINKSGSIAWTLQGRLYLTF